MYSICYAQGSGIIEVRSVQIGTSTGEEPTDRPVTARRNQKCLVPSVYGASVRGQEVPSPRNVVPEPGTSSLHYT